MSSGKNLKMLSEKIRFVYTLDTDLTLIQTKHSGQGFGNSVVKWSCSELVTYMSSRNICCLTNYSYFRIFNIFFSKDYTEDSV